MSKIIFLLWIAALMALPLVSNAQDSQRFYSPKEVERIHLRKIVREIDDILLMANKAKSLGIESRITFNFEALSEDMRSRRRLIENYINGSWNNPRDIPSLSTTYNRK